MMMPNYNCNKEENKRELTTKNQLRRLNSTLDYIPCHIIHALCNLYSWLDPVSFGSLSLLAKKNGSFLYLVISFSLRNGSAFLASITLTFFLDILTVCQKCNENGWKMNTACLELWEESLSTTFFKQVGGSRAIVVVAEKQQLSFLSFTAAPKLAAWMKPPSGHYTRDGQAGRFSPATPPI